MTSTIKPPLNSNISSKSNTYLSSLGPGTLILANGNVVPVLPQSQTIIPQNRTIITNPAPIFVNPQPNNTIIVVASTSSGATATSNSAISGPSSKCSKTLPRLKPKVCLTKTVQMNKVPIPALSSSYSRMFSNQDKVNVVQKAVKQKPTQSAKKVVNVGQNDKNSEVTAEATSDKNIEKNEPAKHKLETASKDIEYDAKRTKADDELDKKSTDEEKSAGDKDDSKKTSEYSIDSLCKEKVKVGNSIAIADSAKTVLPEKNDPVNKENCKESDKKNEQSRSSIEVSSSGQAVNDKTVKEVTAEASVKTLDTRIEISENILNDLQDATKNNDKANFNADVPNVDKPEIIPEPKNLEINLPHSELSNDIFASLQVPTGGQNPESTSPTAAFLLAFPLVSTLTGVKVTEVMEEENSESRHGTPTLLQIGTMDTTKPTHSSADSLTPSLLNLDNFSFFSAKDICSSFYPGFDSFVTTATTGCSVVTTSAVAAAKVSADEKKTFVDVAKTAKVVYETPHPKPTPYVSSGSAAASYTPSIATSKSVTAEKSVNFGPPPVATSSTTSTGVTNNFVLNPLEKKNLQETFQPPPLSVSSYNNYNTMLYGSTSNAPSNSMANNCFPSKSKPNVPPSKSAPKSSTAIPYTVASAKPSYTIAQYNTFNPFTDISKSAVISSYANIARTYTDPLYTNSTAYNYNNCQSDNAFGQNTYMHNRNVPKNENRPYYSTNYDNNSYGGNRKYDNNFANNYCHVQNVQTQNKDGKFANQANKTKNASVQPRPPVNWMTTPDVRQQAPNLDYLLPQFGKELDSLYPPNSFVSNTQTTYFNTNYPTSDLTSNTFMESKKPLETTFSNTFQKNEIEDNQFSWSPTKLPQLLDTQNSFVSSTLPTLVGDLALGTTSTHFADQKVEPNKNVRPKDNRRSNKGQNYDNQANFFSVSQLVEHNKTDAVPARVTGRRNSGGRSGKNAVVAQKTAAKRSHKDTKEVPNYNTSSTVKVMDQVKNPLKQQQNHVVQRNVYNIASHNQEWLSDSTKVNKNPSSSYSAEALISHQPATDGLVQKQRQNNTQNYSTPTSKTLPVPFLTENIIPYFPSVDLQQENTFTQQNQNYHQNSSFGPHNFQSNAYSTNSLISNAPTITTNYLPSTNFMPELGTPHEYNTMISDNLNLFAHAPSKSTENRSYMKNSTGVKPPTNPVNRSEERKTASAANCSVATGNYAKKTKKKQPNEVPGFVDFSFLSMPAAINSPILPDDFHTNFLPPPTSQLYPCKNTLYPPKQNADLNSSALLPLPPVPVSRGNIQHPEISPSMNSVGTSLTNFNLSTIFPEINKVGCWKIIADIVFDCVFFV